MNYDSKNKVDEDFINTLEFKKKGIANIASQYIPNELQIRMRFIKIYMI